MFDFIISNTAEICKQLGQRLRTQRLALGWSQLDLARRAGLSGGTIKNLENKGQASLDSLVRVVSALGLAEGFNELFLIQPVSIAAMEKAERAKRQRAPRKGGA